MDDRQPPQLPPLPYLEYGIWIEGKGWLRHEGQAFADPRREMAEAALRMLRTGGEYQARVALIDIAMSDLEAVFLERERAAKLRASQRAWRKFMRWIDGLFRHQTAA